MTVYLADACALIVFYDRGEVLSPEVRAILRDGRSDVAVSAATVWEIAVKTANGKLKNIVPDGYRSLTDMLQRQGFTLIDITPEHAEASSRLPMHHRDPFDRLMLATHFATGWPIVSNDRILARYGAAMIW